MAGPPPPARPASQPVLPTRGFKEAVLWSLLLVPVAGAAEPPSGWMAAGVTAVVMLVLVLLVGQHVRWGWLSLLIGTAALVTPRGELAAIGPAMLVASGLCLVLWFANRGRERAEDNGRPRLGSRERQAQLLMGVSGERHVGQVLAYELPEDFVLVNGLKLRRGAGDIDHLVVGPTGVFLVETKTMAGQIVCEPDGTWRRTRIGRAGTSYAAYIGDPAAQVQRNIFAVRECLRRRLPALFRGTPLWIEGLVVFPHPRTQLQTELSRVPAVRLQQATQHICQHVPQRALSPDEVNSVVDALLAEDQEHAPRLAPAAQTAQALVEVALMLPVVLALLFGTIALSRVIQAQTAVVAIAHEAARAGALGTGPLDAADRIQRRVALVAPGLGIDPRAIVLSWDVSNFTRERGRVMASVRYAVDLGDLPLGNWVPAPAVQAVHVEWVDPFRSGIAVKETAP